MKKIYKNLRFTNDFLFCKILSSRPALCQELIEMILNVKIESIVSVEQQEPIEIIPDGRGIRLDVRVENADAIYCVEMQTSNIGNIPKRARYYQGISDLSSLGRGSDYENLKKSYVIFICTFDLFRLGYRRYVFRSLCVDNPALEMGDDVEKVFLNPGGIQGPVSDKLQDFLDYLATGKAHGELSRRLEDEVKMAQDNPVWEAEYTAYYLKLHDERKAAREEGREEGLQEGKELGSRQTKIDTARKLADLGMSLPQIASLWGMTEEEIAGLLAEAEDVTPDTEA